MYLMLATTWIIAAMMLFYWSWVDPNNPYNQIAGTGISLGWFAVLMVIYNLVRWWSMRKRQPPQTSTRPTPPRRIMPPDDNRPIQE